MENEVISYIRDAQKHGLTDTEIKQNLLDAGWDAPTVENSFAYVKTSETKPLYNKDEDIHSSSLEEKVFTPQLSREPAVHPQLSISEQQFKQPSGMVVKKHFAIWVAVLILAGLGASGYFAYAYFYNNPGKIWSKFLAGNTSTMVESKYNFEYSDPNNTSDPTSSPAVLALKNVKLGISGDFYIKNTDPSNPESKSTLQYTFASGNTSFSTGFQYLLINKNLYLETGNNPLLNSIVNSAGEGKEYKWVKLDINAFKETMNENKEQADLLDELFNPGLKNDLAKIWEDAKLVKIDKYLGKDQIEGVNTYHFKNSIDKTAVKEVFNNYLTRLYTALKGKDPSITEANMADVKTAITALVDKLEVKEFETWIATKDYKLRKVHFTSNAPSFISFVKNLSNSDVLNPLSIAQSSSRDAKRLADVRQLASAFELYFNDHNGYPAGNKGKPLDLTPNYIGMIPQTPVPADGVCPNWYNTYWYQPKGKKTVVSGKEVYESYELTFCLGKNIGGYAAGIAKLSPQGIQGGLPCTDTAEHCATNIQAGAEPDKAGQIKAFIDKIDYNAQFKADVIYTNYGKEQQVQPPSEYLDVMALLGDARAQSRDAKRMADIRQLASALELYFNDKNFYPKTLKDLSPSYIGVLPEAPKPADGACSENDNQYAYINKSSGQYEISFCLGYNTGGYTAGKHSLSPAGIN